MYIIYFPWKYFKLQTLHKSSAICNQVIINVCHSNRLSDILEEPKASLQMSEVYVGIVFCISIYDFYTTGRQVVWTGILKTPDLEPKEVIGQSRLIITIIKIYASHFENAGPVCRRGGTFCEKALSQTMLLFQNITTQLIIPYHTAIRSVKFKLISSYDDIIYIALNFMN